MAKKKEKKSKKEANKKETKTKVPPVVKAKAKKTAVPAAKKKVAPKKAAAPKKIKAPKEAAPKKAAPKKIKKVVVKKIVAKKVADKKNIAKPRMPQTKEKLRRLPRVPAAAPVTDEDIGRAAKFDIGLRAPQVPPQSSEYENLGELPEAYGTGKLCLIARDPYWLYAYWDLTPDQIGDAERRSHDNKVFLQVYTAAGERLQQIHISPWTREWYIGVRRPEQSFYAEVGYYRHDGEFEVVARSLGVTAPRTGLSRNKEVRYATLPFGLSFRELAAIINSQALPGEEPADTVARLQQTDFVFPFPVVPGGGTAEESSRLVIDAITGELVRRIRAGSEEIVEIYRRQRDGIDLPDFDALGSSPSSPFGASFGAAGDERKFRAHVNAELIIYGGTEPDAKVSVAGNEIVLNEHGNFHYHFNFGDGNYRFPVEMTSADGKEMRSVLLSFLRITDKDGEVQNTPQPPRAEPFGKET